jgi:signal transduction histidine kinase
MSATLAAGGWLAALGCVTAARVVLARRMELVARACHELRGPLTAARLAVHLAAGRQGTPSGPLQAIDLELGRARLALADLSAARQGGRATDHIGTFDVRGLLAEVAQWAQADAAARARRLRLEQLPGRVLVRGDRDRLARACGNLIANAFEHGGGTVLLRARAGVHTLRIEVLDEGPGLPAPVAVLVRRPRAGVGMRGRGLAIVADIAARHGGLLAAAPTERGARLVLELPTAPVPEA